jgi:putative aldouronate transport system permease protein
MKKGILPELYRNKVLFLMISPVLLFFILFSYIPMVGIYFAFTRFNFDGGLFGSQFVGFENFKFLYQSGVLWNLTKNTVLYNLAFILLGNILQLVCAIFISQITSKIFKKTTQSMMFLPFFISWVLVGAFAYNLFNSDNGVFNTILHQLGMQTYDFYLETAPWKYIIVAFSIWKGLGYGTIIYLASIMAISEENYEAAKIDGANIFQQIRHITIPLL